MVRSLYLKALEVCKFSNPEAEYTYWGELRMKIAGVNLDIKGTVLYTDTNNGTTSVAVVNSGGGTPNQSQSSMISNIAKGMSADSGIVGGTVDTFHTGAIPDNNIPGYNHKTVA
jgi:hypothetical protein